MNNDLFQRVLIQLQPELAQEFGFAVLEDRKRLRAFEIIKEKPIVALVDYKHTYEEWLELVDEKDKDLFKNEEEYNLLKEVLKDE